MPKPFWIIAIENKATDALEKDMRSIVATISDSQELKAEMLASPVIDGEAKKKLLLLAIFKGSHSITEKSYFSLLIDNKRIGMLE